MNYVSHVLETLTVILVVTLFSNGNLESQRSTNSIQPLLTPTDTASLKRQRDGSQQEESKNDASESLEIERLLRSQVKAWNQGDLPGFMAGYWKSPKLTFSSNGQTTRGWQSTLDRYKKSYAAPAKMGQLEFKNLEISILSVDVAMVLGNWQLTEIDGEPQGNFSLVLKKMDEQWKIVHDHSSTKRDDDAEK